MTAPQTPNPAPHIMTAPQTPNTLPPMMVAPQTTNLTPLVFAPPGNPAPVNMTTPTPNHASLITAPQTAPFYFASGLSQNVMLPPGNSFAFVESPPSLPVLDIGDVEATLSPSTQESTVETMNAPQQSNQVPLATPLGNDEHMNVDHRTLDEKINAYRESMAEHGVLSPMTESISKLTIKEGKIVSQVGSYEDIGFEISDVRSLKIDGGMFEGEEKVSEVIVQNECCQPDH